MLYWGNVKVGHTQIANIYKDPNTETFRYYVQGDRKAAWSEDFDTFVDAAEDAQSDWLNNLERDG